MEAAELVSGLPARVLYGADGGKMFGVLVVEATAGSVGVLKAFSGQLERRWDIEGFVPPVFDRARAVTVDASLTQLVHRIAAHDTGGAQGNDLDTRRFHWDAAARLGAALVADTGTAAGAQASGAGLDFARIDRWLRAHLSEPLRIADLASHCGFGTRRFHQLFIDAFGETPHRYLQRLRLDTSLGLLSDPRLSLSDIALEIGFGDQSAYTHAFTRRFGLAPGQWRALRH